MNPELTNKSHWNNLYDNCTLKREVWLPSDYDSYLLDYVISKEIQQNKPLNILEIGCGNSTWLPYLARKFNLQIAGLDYSETGCELLRKNLMNEGIAGSVFCEDLFSADPDRVGRYDFVYSLGVVEHFSDIENVIKKMMQFVSPGGILFTEIPNFSGSIYSVISEIWNPELLRMHNKLSRTNIIHAYKSCGLTEVKGDYLGLFSLALESWEAYPRWPGMARAIAPGIVTIKSILDKPLIHSHYYQGYKPLAPYIYATGKKAKV